MIVITNIELSKYQFLKAKVSIRSTKHNKNASKVFDVSFKEGTFDKPSIGKIADWISGYAEENWREEERDNSNMEKIGAITIYNTDYMEGQLKLF